MRETIGIGSWQIGDASGEAEGPDRFQVGVPVRIPEQGGIWIGMIVACFPEGNVLALDMNDTWQMCRWIEREGTIAQWDHELNPVFRERVQKFREAHYIPTPVAPPV